MEEPSKLKILIGSFYHGAVICSPFFAVGYYFIPKLRWGHWHLIFIAILCSKLADVLIFTYHANRKDLNENNVAQIARTIISMQSGYYFDHPKVLKERQERYEANLREILKRREKKK